MQRQLGTNGPVVSALGMGTWGIGGPSSAGSQPLGWGGQYDREAAGHVLAAAFDSGITLFDTADAYGCGTAEQLIGENLAQHRDEITLVSKWGNVINEETRQLEGTNSTPAYVHNALDASLRRLRTDHLDLYLLHLSGLPVAEANDLVGTLVDLVDAGKIGGYGWSTDDPALATAWIGQPGFTAIEFEINVVRDAPELVELCEHRGLAALARGPLGTGLLTGKYSGDRRIEDPEDFRYASPEWLNYFHNGQPVERYASRLAVLTEILTANGRTLAQGALAWLWARSPNLIPIPGARTVEQVRENAAAMHHGPLDPGEMTAIHDTIASLVEPR